jgi:hypothetical protein
LLTFICKCVGVGQAEFETIVAAAGIADVVHEQTPSAMAAAAAADGNSRGSGMAASTKAATASRAAAAAAAAAAATPSPRGSTTAAFAARSSIKQSAGDTGGGSSGGGSGSGSSGVRPGSTGGGGGTADVGPMVATPRASAAARMPGMSIEIAAAAAAAGIVQAVSSAPPSHRSVADGSGRVRVQGVAGAIHGPVQQQDSSPLPGCSSSTAAAPGGTLLDSDNDLSSPRSPTRGSTAVADSSSSSRNAAAAVAGCALVPEESVLPDLGVDDQGQPLSRRVRQQEGLNSWAPRAAAGPLAAAAAAGEQTTAGAGDVMKEVSHSNSGGSTAGCGANGI